MIFLFELSSVSSVDYPLLREASGEPGNRRLLSTLDTLDTLFSY